MDRHPLPVIVFSLLIGFASLAHGAEEAFYVTQSGSEGNVPPARALRVTVEGVEAVEEQPFVWWEVSVETTDGAAYGVRLLSERAAMTSPDGIGRVVRYLYRDANGEVTEYRDAATGDALLPAVRFREEFLPRPGAFAVYDDGFASTGTFQGHTLVRVAAGQAPARRSFDGARVLVLRGDVLLGAQISSRVDREPVPLGGPIPEAQPYTRAELEELIAAGINHFGDVGEQMEWLKQQPVFWHAAPTFPDSFYRGNCRFGHWYMDEPSVRFGWDERVPGAALRGPEQHAEAVAQRVRAYARPGERKLDVGWHSGALELVAPPPLAWDTHYYSAWAQLSAGAAGILYEGRYRDRGYGWSPEAFFGDEGLEGLTFREQLDFTNAFMRGAARAFDAEWGISVYPEGDPALFAEAFRRSYDMGARRFFFWIHPPVVGHSTMLELGRALQEHIARCPRGDIGVTNRQATLAIVLPAGYAITPDGGVWGMQREQRTRGGVTYGDVAAAALAEAILSSRRGIAFDFVEDAPRIRDLGYERLIYVRPDASLEVVPPWPEPRPAAGLALSLVQAAEPEISRRAAGAVDYRVARAPAVTIDGNLEDWEGAVWISMDTESAGASDLVDLDVAVPNVPPATAWEQYRETYLGIQFAQLDTALQRRFNMQDYHIIGADVVDENRPGVSLEQPAIIITEVRPGSPAAEAGLRPGDVIREINGRRMKWHFEVWGLMERGARGAPAQFVFALTRNERTRIGYQGDLKADVALLVDDEHLYLAARVTDDVHAQRFDDWYYWQGDCLQLGLDPTLARGCGGYGEEDHEIALALRDDGRAVVWRYQGRRGQVRGEIERAAVRVVRQDDQTLYEAAIPLEELLPLAPDLWPRNGFNIVINDHDGDDLDRRKGRLELVEGAMTRGKCPAQFALLEYAPSPATDKVSAALFWKRRATVEGGAFALLLAASSPAAAEARVLAHLQSLDSPETPAATAETVLPLAPEAREWRLELATQSPPGRYALEVRLEDGRGRVAASDRLPVLVYPGAMK